MKKLSIEVVDGAPKTTEIINLTITETAAQLGLAVGTIYSELKQRSPYMAKEFKELMGITFLEASPVWGVDVSGVDRISIFEPGKRGRNDA